ncbi:hypothetical protein N9N41_06360, partial [Opitutales bacterium]|nr:hypothetical protein [Opitutales bacterium]
YSTNKHFDMVDTRNSLLNANPPCMTWLGGFALRVDIFTIREYLPCSSLGDVGPILKHNEEALQ